MASLAKRTMQPRRTMVCVTVQKNCERLIREGAAIAGEKGLRVVTVAPIGTALLGAGSDGEALDYLYRIAKEYGAQMDMLRANDIIGTLQAFALRHAIECIIIGSPGVRSAHDFANALRERLPRVSVVVVP